MKSQLIINKITNIIKYTDSKGTHREGILLSSSNENKLVLVQINRGFSEALNRITENRVYYKKPKYNKIICKGFFFLFKIVKKKKNNLFLNLKNIIFKL